MGFTEKDIFVWDKSVCQYDSIKVENEAYEISISNGGYLYLLNKKNEERCILRKEFVSLGAFYRPNILFSGGFGVIWSREALEEIGDVVGQAMGTTIELKRKDKEAFEKLEGLTRVLHYNGVKTNLKIKV